MWSFEFTSKRSMFSEAARVGLHARAPTASEATTAEAVRLSLRQRFRLVLVDYGAAVSVGTVIKARLEGEPSRSEYMVIARLASSCTDTAVAQANAILEELGVEYVDGLCVPWPEDGGHQAFGITWRALTAALVPGRARALGCDHLHTWQLERLEDDPAFNLVSTSAMEPATRTVAWCHSRGIEVLSLVANDASPVVAAVAADLGGVEEWLVRLRWALHNGLVAFPDVSDWVAKGADLKTADAYETWMADFANMLRSATLHLHFPAERRRLSFNNDVVSKLAALDAITCNERARFDAFQQLAPGY